nr:hypothetical protein Iba_chr14aCG18790 [Ipomoea batatas]
MAAELKHPRPSPIKSQYEDSPTELFNPLLSMVVFGVFHSIHKEVKKHQQVPQSLWILKGKFLFLTAGSSHCKLLDQWKTPTLNIHLRLEKDNHFKPVFSLQSMCLGMSLALYTARFQEWLRLVPPGQAPPPQNGNVPRPAAAGAQAGQNVDGSSAAGGQPLQNVGAPPAQLQNENDPLLEDEDNAGDQLAVESEVAAPSDYAAFEIEN